jgi:formylmethanofuran dehydrogenase subunit A
MRVVRLAVVLGLVVSVTAHAAERFVAWNLTATTTFSGIYLAPAGSTAWGPNQALNDKDHTLEPSERLILKGVGHGRFDVRLVDQAGHACIKHDVDLSTAASFDIRDADLDACR